MNALSHPRLLELVQAVGTPTYIYDARIIHQRIAALRAFDVIRYAQKANANRHILRLMRSAGVLVDAVSAGEIQRALAVGYQGAGHPAGLVYTADVLPPAALDLVTQHDIPVNAGSLDMLEQLGSRQPGHRVWLRINPGFGHGHSRKTNTGGPWSKHGIWHTAAPTALASLRAHGLQLVGLHMHIGSGSDLAHLQRVGQAMVKLVRNLGVDVAAISSGGGLPIPYRPNESPFDVATFFQVWDDVRRQIEGLVGHSVAVECEPGRYLVAEAGQLVSTVLAVKRDGPHQFVLVDAGFDNLVRPAMYGSYHAISVIKADGARVDGPTQPTIVAGPLCEAGDVFTQAPGGRIIPRDLPAIAVGDWLIFHDAGAYAATMASTYNSRPLAPEILIDADGARLIRRRQTIEDLLALEMGDDAPPLW